MINENIKRGLQADKKREFNRLLLNIGASTTSLMAAIVSASFINAALIPSLFFTGVSATAFAVSTNNILKTKYDDLAIGCGRDKKHTFTQSSNKNLEKALKQYQIDRNRAFSVQELAGIMEFQLLMAIDREKQKLSFSRSKNNYDLLYKNTTPLKLFKKIYSTRSHTINLALLKIMEDLGYIHILSDDNLGTRNLSMESKMLDDITNINTEKLPQKDKFTKLRNQFSKFCIGIAASILKDNPLFIKNNFYEMNREMHEVTFRLTDKPINVQDILEFGRQKNIRSNKEEETTSQKNDYRRAAFFFLRTANKIVTIDNNGLRNHLLYQFNSNNTCQNNMTQKESNEYKKSLEVNDITQVVICDNPNNHNHTQKETSEANHISYR